MAPGKMVPGRGERLVADAKHVIVALGDHPPAP